MSNVIKNWFWDHVVGWLTEDRQGNSTPLSDFERLSYEIRPCDVILVEGNSHISDVIKIITQSSWTHAALYIGRLHDIDSPALREKIGEFYSGDPGAQLLVETTLESGTTVTPLSRYQRDHLRICRAKGLTRQDAQHITGFAVNKLGGDYNLRQILDLARFMFPYAVLPRRWRSSLFSHNTGEPTRTVCSTMLAQAFGSVKFPIMPIIKLDEKGRREMFMRNPRLFTPSDFDYSPYFDIIKYPVFGIEGPAMYRSLPWNPDGMVCNDDNECFIPIEGGKE